MIKDIQTALEIFEDSCIKHSKATEEGNFKKANKYHSKITNVVKLLKIENAITSLEDYLSSPFESVRLWSAYYWLPVNELEGIRILEEISKSQGINSLNAEATISEWKKGNLKF